MQQNQEKYLVPVAIVLVALLAAGYLYGRPHASEGEAPITVQPTNSDSNTVGTQAVTAAEVNPKSASQGQGVNTAPGNTASASGISSIRLPAGWIAEPVSNPEVQTVLYTNRPAQSSLEVRAYRKTRSDEYAQRKSSLTSLGITGTNTTIGGRTAFVTQSEATSNYPVSMKTWIIDGTNYVYWLTASMPPDEKRTYEPLFDAAVQTLQAK